jgi:2',3'-cyclic-nucleotide 2'-phosphodiesterase (5'-nucleotidase family)
MFTFYQTGEYIKKRGKVDLNIIPKLQNHIAKLNEYQIDKNIKQEIENKEIIIEALKYYYSL